MDLIVASNNNHKLVEIKSIIGSYFDNIYSLSDQGININIAETGTTFYENSFLKASTIYNMTGIATLADDSGLVVDALGGKPGVYSARYSGESASSSENNSKLLDALKGINNRVAHFACSVVLITSDGTKDGYGEVVGSILREYDGDNGFGYDPIFYCNEINKSFGQASVEEKNQVSHRARALLNLLTKI